MPTAVELTRGMQISSDFLAVLQRIANLYPAIVVTQGDNEYIRFYVTGVPDAFLFGQLQKINDHDKSKLFGQHPEQFQILCPRVPDGKPGIFLHHLSTPALQVEFCAGVWQY